MKRLIRSTLILVAAVSSAAFAQDADTDHSRVTQTLGLHYFGETSVPVLGSTGTYVSSLAVPTIGVRYWLAPKLGLDIGLGFSVGVASTASTAGGTTTTTAEPSNFAIGGHVGVPIVMAESKHLIFFLEPGVGYFHGSSSYTEPGTNGAQHAFGSNDFGIGADAAIELYLGFIGLPQVSLGAQLGLAFDISGQSDTVTVSGNSATSSASAVGIGTLQGGFGFANVLFSSFNITYYFGAR